MLGIFSCAYRPSVYLSSLKNVYIDLLPIFRLGWLFFFFFGVELYELLVQLWTLWTEFHVMEEGMNDEVKA